MSGTEKERDCPRKVAADVFLGDGRGPELQRLIWRMNGTALRAAEYRSAGESSMRHVVFEGVQVVQITPEEVLGAALSPSAEGYAIDLGRSEWLQSFNPHHLGACKHYRLLFYDELLDVICESLSFRPGPYME